MSAGAGSREELVKLLQAAVGEPRPEKRLVEVRALAPPFRHDGERDLDAAVVATLSQVAYFDANEVLVETALESLLPYAGEEAFFTWKTVALERRAVPREQVNMMAHRLASPHYAKEMVATGAADPGAAREIQGRRALEAAIHLAEHLPADEAQAQADAEAARTLAERALVNLEDAASVMRAREVLERVAR